MRKQLIAGNWKMNGTIDETKTLLEGLLSGSFDSSKADMVVCPPFTALSYAGNLLKGSKIAVGAQDMSVHENGAYTAEISAGMLLTVGVSFVILGHSERRQYHAESNQMINAKAKVAIEAGLTPIICVGETLEDRESGNTETVIGQQIDGTLFEFSAELLNKSVIAYEPVWAIGTGKTATPEMAQDVHQFIRNRIAGIDKEAAEKIQILYGGSVKPDNAKSLLSQPDIDGALVGGAALKADDFLKIINSL